MATLTKAQAQKWNSQLAAGFRFDVRHFVMFGGKVARRNIELGNGKILQATLQYDEVRDGYRYTGQVQPTLHFQIWENGSTDGIMCSRGLGATLKIGAPQNKKLWSVLCELSANFSDEKLLSLASEKMEQLKNPFVL